MTEEQVAKWIKRRNEAKQIADPVARQQALDLVYDMRDDMQLDCFRKQADRIKEGLRNDERLSGEIRAVKTELDTMKAKVEAVEKDLPNLKETAADYKNMKERGKGAKWALQALDYIFRLAGAGGLGAAIYTAIKGGPA